MECYRCGVPEFKTVLYDVISPDGIQKICKSCATEVSMPIVKKTAESTFQESSEKTTVRDRLVKLSGYQKQEEKKPEVLEKQEGELKDVIKENLPELIKATRISSEEFIDNFHWLIMRQRRIKKLSQKELAEEIREPEIAVKLAEQGIISPQTPLLVEKLEKYLHVYLRRDTGFNPDEYEPHVSEEISPMRKKVESMGKEEEISFDPLKTKEITIGELKSRDFEMKHEKTEKPLDERKLSKEDIDDILFGR